MRPDRTYQIVIFQYIYSNPDTYLLLTKLSNSNTISSDVIINLTFKLHAPVLFTFLLKLMLMVKFHFLVVKFVLVRLK